MGFRFVEKEHYRIAKERGISQEVVYSRVYLYCWDIERAISEPVKKYDYERSWTKWKETAEKHGVTLSAYYSRVKRGMEPEEAATKPLMTRSEAAILANKNRDSIIRPEHYEAARKIGIGAAALRSRVFNYGFSIEKALTQPLRHNGKLRYE